MASVGSSFFCALKQRAHLLLPLFILCCSSAVFGQNISSTINTYAHIIAYDSCSNEVTVPSTTGFSVGDTVLLLIMQGATVDATNSPNFGYPTSISAGRGEFAEIAAIPDGTHLQFKDYLQRNYVTTTATGATVSSQVITVPHFTDAQITGPLTAAPWNPTTGTGGVLIVRVFDTLTLRADIDVSALGFRGGNPSLNGGAPDYVNYYCSGSSGNGGFKGEGVAGAMPNDLGAGRGAAGSGGGGGNSHNSGGGGGGGFGEGGMGGRETDPPAYAGDVNGGVGGWKDTDNLLVLGGGGGGGHQNDGKGSAGGNGGGIVIILADYVAGNGYAIRANGADADSSDVDGAGGGGGGGSIWFDVQHVLGTLELSAGGGKGGDADAGNGLLAFGPGGGGGGGRIAIRSDGGIVTHEYGGSAGRLRNCIDSSLVDPAYGATAGTAGDTLSGDIYNSSDAGFSIPSADNHVVIGCVGSPVTISATGGGSYLWSPALGMSDPTQPQETVSPDDTTLYTVQISRGACVYDDTVRVNVLPKPLTNFMGPKRVCGGGTETYSIIQQPGTMYSWSVTGGTPLSGTGDSITVTWKSAGSQEITLTATNGVCSDNSRFQVDVAAPILPHILATKVILLGSGDSSILSLGGGYLLYLWSTGETASSVTVDSPGTYSVTVIDSNGCTGTDSIAIGSASASPFIELALPAISAKPGEYVTLPINIVAAKNLGSASVTGFTYTLHYDQSLLKPVDPFASSIIKNGQCYVSKHGTISNQLSLGTMDQIEFLAALGNATQTAITLDTVVWQSEKSILSKLDSGQFTLLGVCPAGGNRLFESDGVVALNGVSPNPVNGIGVADYSLAEPGETRLELLDMLGRTVLTISDGTATPGEYRATFNSSEIPNGMYNLLLRTPTQTFSKQIEVYH